MAIIKIYSIRDVRTEAYMRPFFLQNDAVLERTIQDARDDENNLMHHHPEDYQCFELGTFDEQTGEITAQPPKHKFNLVDIKTRKLLPESE